MPKMSVMEEMLAIRVDALETALSFLCDMIKQNLPAMSGPIESINNQMTNMHAELDRLVPNMVMGGQGVNATTLRRMQDPTAERYIEMQTPAKATTKRRDHPEPIAVINGLCGTHDLLTEHPTHKREWDLSAQIALDPDFLQPRVVVSIANVAELSEGFYEYASNKPAFSSYSNDTPKYQYLTKDVGANNTAVLIDSKGGMEYFTYVAIEDTWVQHRNDDYVDWDDMARGLQWLKQQSCWATTGLDHVAVVDTLRDKIAELQIEASDKWHFSRYNYSRRPSESDPAGNYRITGHESNPCHNKFVTVIQGVWEFEVMWFENKETQAVEGFRFRCSWYNQQELVGAQWDELSPVIRQKLVQLFVERLTKLSEEQAKAKTVDSAETA